VLAAVAVGATYLLGARLLSFSGGIIAALLVATNPLFLFLSGMYLTHTLGILLAALTGFLLIYGEDKTAVARKLAWLGAGFLLAFMVTVRPLTGLIFGASLLMWLLFIRKKLEIRKVRTFFSMLITGSLVPIVFLLHYNVVTTGNTLTVGYQIANHEFHNLGFGERGYIAYNSHGNPIKDTINFTPLQAVKQNLDVLYDAATLLLPAFIIFPLILFGLAHGFPFSWQAVFVFLPLPIVHFFYFFPDVRFYVELLPFLCVGISTVLLFLESRYKYLARSLLIFMLICNVGQAAKMIYEEYVFRQRDFAFFKYIEDFADRHGKVIVFVKGKAGHEYLLEALYWFNVDKFPGNIIVARDIGERNSILLKKFPEHNPLYFSG
jgi:4-amino-4-deoxy-L-arabinose transferase-like glycosyltransferase